MAKRDDITATEKLLDLIRKSPPVPNPAASGVEPSSAQPPKPSEEPERDASEAVSPPSPLEEPPLELEIELEEEEQEGGKPSGEPEGPIKDSALLRQESAAASAPALRPIKGGRRLGALLRFGRRQLMLAVHADANRLDLALLARQGSKLSLQDFRSASRPADSEAPEWHFETLGRLAGEMIPGRRRLPASLVLADATRVLYHLLPPLAADQQANAIYWAIKKEQELDDATTIFDYQVVAELTIKDQQRTLYGVSLADRNAVSRWQEACEGCQLDLESITTPHQALHGLARQCGQPSTDTPAAFLCIGDNHSIILVYHQQGLVFSRTINTGLSALDEEGFERLSQDTAKTLDEAFAFERCDPSAIGRLLRQVQRTLDYCASTYEVPAVEEVRLLGLPAAAPAFVEHCASELQVACRHFDPFAFDAVSGGTVLLGESPALIHRRSRLLAAVGGGALKPHQDQNFLFTYRDRQEQRRAHRLSQAIILGFSLVFAGLVAVNALFTSQNEKLGAELRALKQEIAAHKELLGDGDPQAVLLATIGKIRKRRLAAERHAQRHLPLALCDAVIAALPKSAQLTSIEYRKKKATGKEAEQHLLRIGAILTAPSKMQEVALAALLKRLGGEPLLATRPRVRAKKEIAGADGGSSGLFAIIEFSVPGDLFTQKPAAQEGK